MSELRYIATAVFSLMMLIHQCIVPYVSILCLLSSLNEERTMLLSSARNTTRTFPAWRTGPFLAY